MTDKPPHPLALFRFTNRLTMRAAAEKIGSSYGVVFRAEHGVPIRRKYIERLVEFSKGALKPEDFIEGDLRNGSTSKSGGGRQAVPGKKEGDRR